MYEFTKRGTQEAKTGREQIWRQREGKRQEQMRRHSNGEWLKWDIKRSSSQECKFSPTVQTEVDAIQDEREEHKHTARLENLGIFYMNLKAVTHRSAGWRIYVYSVLFNQTQGQGGKQKNK